MKVKQKMTRTLVIFGSLAIITVILGMLTDEGFYTTLGLFVAILGICFSTITLVKQTVYVLKKNNLWIDELPKDPDLKAIQDAIKKRGIDSKEEYDKMMDEVKEKNES